MLITRRHLLSPPNPAIRCHRCRIACWLLLVGMFYAALVIARAWQASTNILLMIENPQFWLGAAESFVDDFFWSWWRFEISVFNLISVGRG